MCGLTSIWVLGVNYILLVKSTGIEITSIFARPAVVNSVALLLPIFYIGSVVGSCTAVAVSYDKVLDILDEVYAELDAAAAAWEGAPLSLAAMGPELVALARIQAPDALFMWRMRWIFGVTFAWGVIIFFVRSFAPDASLFKALSRLPPRAGHVVGCLPPTRCLSESHRQLDRYPPYI